MTNKKLKRIVEKTKTIRKSYRKRFRLRPDDIQYIIELANEHPTWDVGRIFEEALRPRLRNCLEVPLTPKIKKQLEQAARRYQISMVDIVYHVLQDFFKERKIQ